MFYDRTVTASGVTVISEHMDGVRSVALGIWIAAGSRDEARQEAGISHFIEHMMFKGTATKSAIEISEAFDRMGAEVNAFTSKEYTCYYSRVLDTHAGDAFGILADMVTSSVMEESALKSEREVVLEEISRHEDTPDDLVHDVFTATLFGDHPVAGEVLGSRETVGDFMPSDIFAYTGRKYRAGDVVVAGAGNIDHATLVSLVEELLTLTPAERSDRGERPSVVTPRLEVVRKDTEQAHICWGTAGLPSAHPDRFVLSVLDTVLGGGMSSRLFQEIREKRGLAYAVFSYHQQYLDAGGFTVYAGTRPENTEQVVRLIQDEVAKMLEGGVTPDELYRAKESIKGQLVLSMESTSNRMTRLGKSEVTHGEILSLDELVAKVEAVTSEDVSRVAADTIGGTRVLAMVAPFDAEKVAHLLG